MESRTRGKGEFTRIRGSLFDFVRVGVSVGVWSSGAGHIPIFDRMNFAIRIIFLIILYAKYGNLKIISIYFRVFTKGVTPMDPQKTHNETVHIEPFSELQA
jgi:hypothetical protein